MILDTNGRTLVNKLTPDEARLLFAMSKPPKEWWYIDGIVEGIMEITDKPQEFFHELLDSLKEKGMIQNSFDHGKVVSDKGWEFIAQFKKALREEKKVERIIIADTK